MRVVILGGGTSGWITAAMLQSIHRNAKEKPFDITVVEAPSGRIGVGEGTFPTIRQLLKSFQIDEKEFLRRTDASFKLGIRFDDWEMNPKDKPGSYYYHPFGTPRTHRNLPLAKSWAERFDRGDRIDLYAGAVSYQAALMDHGRAPKRLNQAGYESQANYAYHLDADKLGDYLIELCTARGVKRVIDRVTRVDVDERGWVKALETEANGSVPGDFFVDCSGFLGLIINKTLGAPFVSFNQYLICDRAVAMRVPLQPGEKIRPYTLSAAMDAGWRWSIDLRERRGTGYVYSSAFISDDEAERALRAVNGAAGEGQPARILPMRVGHNPQAWKNNCVAIGLSSGFLEPLEATGIYLIEVGARLLAEHLPYGEIGPQTIANYNRLMTETFHELCDFINLHYCLSQRTDTPFWREVGHRRLMTDRLRAQLELWDYRPPRDIDFTGPLRTYQSYSWECVLFGLGWRPKQWGGVHGASDLQDVDRTFDEVRLAQKRAVADLPEHGHFLSNY